MVFVITCFRLESYDETRAACFSAAGKEIGGMLKNNSSAFAKAATARQGRGNFNHRWTQINTDGRKPFTRILGMTRIEIPWKQPGSKAVPRLPYV
jgi:hypothetical protein